jgi:hypothetical protein
MVRQITPKFSKNLSHLLQATLVLLIAHQAQVSKGADTPAYTARQALCGDTAACHELQPFEKWISAQWQIANSLKLTPAASNALRFTSDALQSLSLQLFTSTPIAHVQSDGTRFFSFTGKTAGDSYVVDYVKSPPNGLSPQKFLDGGLQFGILYNDGKKEKYGPGYRMSWLGFLQTDELNHKAQMALTSRQLKVIDPSNLAKLTPKQLPYFTNNEGLGRTILNEMGSVVPKFSAFMNDVSKVTVKAETKSSGSNQWLKFTIRASLNIDRIQESYANLGAYLERIMRFVVVKSSTELLTSDGLKIINFGYNSASHEISMSFLTAGGAFLPEDESGEPVFSKALIPSELKTFDGELNSAVDLSVLGLRMNSKETKFSMSYRDGTVARFDWKLTGMPIPSFSGALFGLMPPGFLDVMMPGNLREYSKILTVGLVKGNGGRGTFGSMEVNSTVHQSTIIRTITSTEIKDNFFLNIGLRVITDYLWPTPETVDDFRMLMGDSLGELRDDLIAIRGTATQ